MEKFNYRRLMLFMILSPASASLFAQASQQEVNAYKKKLNIPTSEAVVKNPYANNPSVTDTGKTIYAKMCSTCHGTKGKGDGIAATGLGVKPANHTSDLIQMQKDGELFYIIAN